MLPPSERRLTTPSCQSRGARSILRTRGRHSGCAIGAVRRRISAPPRPGPLRWEGGDDRFDRPGFDEHLRGWEGWLAVQQVRRRARRPRRDGRLLELVIGRRVSLPVELFHGGGGLVVGQWQDVAVDPQRGGGVAVPEPVLGLQDVSLGHQGGGHGVRRRWRVTSGWPASVQSSANQCARQDVESRVVWSARRENSHGPNRWPSLARCRHCSTVCRHRVAVVLPRVSRRIRPVLVGPTTSFEVPLAMVSTSPSRSVICSAASLPAPARRGVWLSPDVVGGSGRAGSPVTAVPVRVYDCTVAVVGLSAA